MPIERITELPPVERRFKISPIEREGFDVARGPVFRPTPPSAPPAPKPKAIAKVEPVVKPPPPAKKTEKPVSIHKSILKTLGGALNQRIATKLSPAAILPGIGAIGRVLTGRVATAGGIGAAVGSLFAGGGGGDACPAGFHFAKDGSGRCVRNRRMNFGNARAARRSVRRLKGARKLLRDIEKMMPTRSTKRRSTLQHHHHPAAGGS